MGRVRTMGEYVLTDLDPANTVGARGDLTDSMYKKQYPTYRRRVLERVTLLLRKETKGKTYDQGMRQLFSKLFAPGTIQLCVQDLGFSPSDKI